MPIYEYTCKACHHSLEALQKMSDKPLRKCPACGKATLEKMVSAASFRLKGGGWYETDFKTGDKKQLADSESGSSADSKGDDKKAAPADTSKKDTAKTPAPDSATAGKSTAKPDKSAAQKKAK